MQDSENTSTPLSPLEFEPTPIFTSRFIQCFLILFLMTALLNHQRDFALFTLLLLSVAFGARLWSGFSLARIQIVAAIDRKKLFPGETVRLAIQVKNAKWLPVWLRVDLPQNVPAVAADEGQDHMESGLLWYQTVTFDWTFNPLKRGVYALGPPRIVVGDLMGFYPREKKERDAFELIVFPRLLPLKSFSFARRDYFGTPGSNSPVRDPVYVLGTQDYQPWRPARYIHWKASSRQNQLQEKIFEPSEQAKVLMVLETGQFELLQAETAFENTLELAASMAVQLHRKGYALGFLTDGAIAGKTSGTVPVARSSRQLSAILEILARLKMKKNRAIDDFFHKGLDVTWGVTCVRFAYRDDPSEAAVKNRLRQKKIPFVSYLYDTQSVAETGPPFSREPFYRVEDMRYADKQAHG